MYNIIIDSLCKDKFKKLKRLGFGIQEKDLEVKKNNYWIMSFFDKDLEAKKKKEIWKQADKKKKIENGWICIEEIMMIIVCEIVIKYLF